MSKYSPNKDIKKIFPIVAFNEQAFLIFFIIDIPDISVHAPNYNYCFTV